MVLDLCQFLHQVKFIFGLTVDREIEGQQLLGPVLHILQLYGSVYLRQYSAFELLLNLLLLKG